MDVSINPARAILAVIVGTMWLLVEPSSVSAEIEAATKVVTTRELIQRARRLETQQPSAAAQLFMDAAGRDDVPEKMRAPLQLRAIQRWVDAGDLDAASAWLVPMLKSASLDSMSDEHRRQWTKSTLQIAGLWSAADDDLAADRLYGLLMRKNLGGLDAIIGAAWTRCKIETPPWDACATLLKLASKHPQHSAAEASRTLALEQLTAALETHLIQSQTAQASTLASEPVLKAFRLWHHEVGDGHVLTRWLHQTDAPSAVTIAEAILASNGEPPVDACGRAAARWCGRTGHWHLLATSSQRVDLDRWFPVDSAVGDAELAPLNSRALKDADSQEGRRDMTRLMAESLVQTGQPARSLVWWRRLVESGGGDFASRLRLAEIETAIGDDLAVARESLQSARIAVDRADENAARQYLLVDMVEANFAIRQADFDRARYLLEQVVRRPQRSNRVAGTAQWLIGETYAMQGDASRAIEAYRRVDGIDPDGENSAAALLQAGRCFEQLGRTREATVCYEHLLTRFADSPHAAVASTAMATLGSRVR